MIAYIGTHAIGPAYPTPERPDWVDQQPHPDGTPSAFSLKGDNGYFATVDRNTGTVQFTQNKAEWNERFFIDGQMYLWFPDGNQEQAPFCFLRTKIY